MKHSNYPADLMPVLARIEHQNSLGISCWYEVVYFNNEESAGGWRSFAGSTTFDDGERVVAWRYCSDIEMDEVNE